ncbi:MAG: Crp/Fnr family transcriptional regulator [Nitrospinaceae bacterium]
MEFEKALELFANIPFFDEFNLEEKRFLASLDCNLITCKDGETIIGEGELDLSLFILLQGSVRVTREKSPGAVLSKLQPGAVFGEISLIRKKPRTTSALAEGNTVVLKMDGEMIERLNPLLLNKIKNQLIELLVKRLDEMNDQLQSLAR